MVCAPNQASAYRPPWMNQATAWAWASAAWSLEDWSDAKNSAAGGAALASTGVPQDAGASAASWVHQDVQPALTSAQKEKMKLRKKLREIQKIEELMTTQEKVDPLQVKKVDKKDELVAQLESIEQMEGDELRGAEEPHEIESLEVAPEDNDVQQVADIWSGAQFHEDQPQLQPQHPQWRQQLQRQQQQQHHNASGPKSATARRRERRKRAEKNHSTPKANSATPRESAAEDNTALTGAAGGTGTLLDRLQGDAAERKEALNALHGSVVKHAFSPKGCRAVQQALQVADLETASELLAEVHGHVRWAAESPHANYVVQKIVEVMPPSHGSFVVKELKGVAAELARHRYGCRIFCRVVEHSVGGEDFTELMDELLADALGLSRHQFGHYVMQSLLEHGSQEHRKRLVAALCDDIRKSAHHRWASHVIETALSYCAAEEQHSIAVGLGTWDEDANDAMVSLAQTQFGSFVIKALIRVPGEPGRVVWANVQHARSQLEVNRYGQRVLESGAQSFRLS